MTGRPGLRPPSPPCSPISPRTRPRPECASSTPARRHQPPALVTTTLDPNASVLENMRRNAPEDTGLSPTIEDSLVGGVAWILNGKIRRGEAERAPDLLPELLDFVLSPYRGVGKPTR